jgi:SAM-dependent methyltransferase
MKKYLSSSLLYLNLLGFDPYKTFTTLRGLPAFISDYIQLRRQRPLDKIDFRFGRFYPCLGDRFAEGGQAKGHYFHQDLLVASKISNQKPKLHIDVGSRIDGFVAHVASFREITIIDIRHVLSKVKNITFLQADLMNKLPDELLECCDSLSCLHALEHFGLGRYGDPVCWNGHAVGFENLLTLLKPGGKFYFSVPIGYQRIEFNAHRVFSIAYLLDMFAGQGLHIDEFSFVDDRGNLHECAKLDQQNIKLNFGCSYGCGIFELTKF